MVEEIHPKFNKALYVVEMSCCLVDMSLQHHMTLWDNASGLADWADGSRPYDGGLDDMLQL